jgi:hypothetical protein
MHTIFVLGLFCNKTCKQGIIVLIRLIVGKKSSVVKLSCIFDNQNEKYSYFYVITCFNHRDRLMESY